MRVYWFLFFIVFSSSLFGQSVSSNNKHTIVFSITCYNPIVNSEEELNFNLSITNISNGIIKIPTHYSIAPYKAYAGNIGYQVFYCGNNDTLDYTKLIVAHQDGEISFANDYDLKSKASYAIQSLLEPLYFNKRGVYKVRFVMKKESFIGIISDNIYTDWVFLTVKEAIWPPSKEGYFPLIRDH